MPPRPPAEFSLLAACCRWPQTEAALARVAALARLDLDWAHVLALARRHRVEALAFRALGRAKATLPAETHAALHRDAIGIARRGLGQAGLCLDLARSFAARGLRLAILKGAPLAQLAYGDPALKSAWDVDALIDPALFADAAAILAELGFAPSLAFHDAERADEEVTPDQLARWSAHAKETIWVRARDGVVVELHTRLTDSPDLLSGIGSATPLQNVPVAGGTVPTFDDAELYAYLCVHGASHAWERLKWLADLCAFLARFDERALSALHARAHALGAGRCSAQALLLGDELGLLTLPDHMRSALSASTAARAMTALARHVVVGSGATELTERRLGTVPIHLSHFLFSSRWAYLRGLVGAKLNPTTEAIASPLPGAARRLQPLLAVPRWLRRRARARRAAKADARQAASASRLNP